MTNDHLTTESTIYVTYIASSAEKVWSALTSSEFTKQFFFGRLVESDWKIGSEWKLRRDDGAIDVFGLVRESSPPKRLVLTWKVDGPPEMRNLPEAIVTYEIEPVGDSVVRLTMTEEHPTPIPAQLLEGGRRGWPMILSCRKSLLETGKPMPLPAPKPPIKESTNG